MGFMDDIVGKALGALRGSEQSGLVQGIFGLLANQESGGLAGLVQSFKDKGLGEIVSSWVGTGQNLPITPQQMSQGLGTERIQQLAAQAGLTPDVLSAKLSALLPGIVDKLTPQGTIPEGGLLEKGLELLKGKLNP